MKGTVKWFNDAKGYGFVRLAGKGDMGPREDREAFVHHTDIVSSDDRKTLNAGDEVEFDLYEDEINGVTRKHAKNVRKV